MRLGMVFTLFTTLTVVGTHLAAQAPQTTGTGTIHLTAAIKNSALQVVPIALTRFMLIGTAGDSLLIDTGRDGNAAYTVPAGDYTLVSAEPVEMDGKRYRWSVNTRVQNGVPTRLDLSNLNAITEAIDPEPRTVRAGRIAPEADLFRRLGSAVVRVEAGLGHGSGFIADSLGGVIITNAHVIGNAGDRDVSVVLDSLTRVAAQILARDNSADIAVLRIAPRFLEGRTRLALHIGSGDNAVVPGERLIALGFPLHQGLTMTSGIASGIREGAIISDVNINPGNSGGPLVNLDGEVVAVNTFGDGGARGPGVSGSVLMAQAAPALQKAAIGSVALGAEAEAKLPTMPLVHMSASGLRAAAAAVNYKEYRRYNTLGVLGRFTLTVQTPLATFADIAHYEEEVGKDRRRREERAGLTGDERFSEIKEYRDWVDYVGDITTPVVSIVVQPDIGETGGSIFGRALSAALVGVQSRATYKFKGDVRGVQLFRGDTAEPIVPLRGGHAPQSVWEENRWVQLKDVADLGYYVFDPEVFRPAPDGTTPLIIVAVEDLKHPGKWSCRTLPKETVARAWNDFEDYYREHRGDMTFNVADRRAKVDGAAARELLKERCRFQ